MPPYRFVQGKVARHIAVDLDGTLAYHEKWEGVEHIGEPIKPMVDRVKDWLDKGHKVTVFTARSHDPKTRDLAEKTIQDWTEEHIGQRLPVTHEKSPHMDEFWDDRATHVERNTGKVAGSLEFYHYVDPAKWESVQKHGLLSLRGLREAGLTEDYQAALAKYKDRISQSKAPVSDQEVEDWLHNLRGEGWDDYLYAFRQPIPADAAQPFRDYAATHKLVKFRVPASTALYDYKAGVHPDFSRPPEGELLFQNIPHVGVQIGRSVPAEEVLPVKAAVFSLPKKEHYRSADPSEVKSFFVPGQVGSAKIDGAAVILHASPAGLETYSIRPSVTGDPIEHTERLGVKPPVDPKHQGLMLRGELYGVRKDTGKAIPAHELGGILNAGVPNSLAKQKAQNVSLRVAVFDVHAPDKPYADRLDLVKDVLAGLPADKFHLPPMATDPKAMAKMWDEISGGKHPLTQEGMVFTPLQDGKPTKVKLRPEADVTIRKVFPGEGKLEGKGAGGFEYSVDDSGQVVGRVGTGFSQAVREDMLSHPEQWIDRIARIRSQGQFESGAHRAPSFIARHEG